MRVYNQVLFPGDSENVPKSNIYDGIFWEINESR